MQLEDRFVGCFLGLSLGAPHEGGPIEKLAWRPICLPYERLLRWTDDTQMTMGLAESLIEKGGLDCGHLAGVWARKPEVLRGYGPSTRRILTAARAGRPWQEASREIFPQGPFGNGAALALEPDFTPKRFLEALLAGARAELERLARDLFARRRPGPGARPSP